MQRSVYRRRIQNDGHSAVQSHFFFLQPWTSVTSLILSLSLEIHLLRWRENEIDDDESLMKNPGTRNRSSSSLRENGVV